jgi:hypothetical protein
MMNDDELLMQLASRHRDVSTLLNAVFGFLHAHTDLYAVVQDPAACGFGFRPGEAETRVLNSFRAFPMVQRSPGDKLTVPKAVQPARLPAAAGSAAATTASAVRTAEGKLIPMDNGAELDGLKWTQSLREVFVHLKVPPGTRGKDVACTLCKDQVSVAVNGQLQLKGAWPVHETIVVAESCWGLECVGSSRQSARI